MGDRRDSLITEQSDVSGRRSKRQGPISREVLSDKVRSPQMPTDTDSRSMVFGRDKLGVKKRGG